MPKPQLVDLKYDQLLIDDNKYKAILFVFGDKEVWLPRDLIEVNHDHSEVTVPVWLAEEKEIENHG